MGYYSEFNKHRSIQEFVKRLQTIVEKTSVSNFLNLNLFYYYEIEFM